MLRLKAKASESFCCTYGYDTSNLEACLERLKERIAQCEEFPHEIGMFLGYPLEDVRGFIEKQRQELLLFRTLENICQ